MIFDHGTSTGQEVGDLRADEIHWETFAPYVDLIVFMGCKSGAAGEMNAAISVQIDGTVVASTINVTYDPLMGALPYFTAAGGTTATPTWKRWFQGTLVDVVIPDQPNP
jgi:hypothetical protein